MHHAMTRRLLYAGYETEILGHYWCSFANRLVTIL